MVAMLAMGLLGATTSARAELWVDESPHQHPHSHGNAPSPEVGILLGFLVVAGTVVFIKRRRDDKAGTENTAA